MTQLTLNGTAWTLGANLGSGGFGNVVRGTNSAGETRALKIIPPAPGIERENEIARHLPTSNYLIPVLESGQTSDGRLVLVMPIAEPLTKWRSTQPVPLDTDVALQILLDVARGLADLKSAEIVHRDLKPENILSYDKTWRLADFGIARLHDIATATHTYKDAHTAPYTAPERWQLQTARYPADIYSFGVIAYELLSGELPFPGPDFRTQHLTLLAPELPVGPSSIKYLVDGCLSKSPDARPTIEGVIAHITKALAQPASGPGREALAAANLAVKRTSAAAEARQNAATISAANRAQLHADAVRSFGHIADQLLDAIRDSAGAATIHLGTGASPERFTVNLGPGRLGLSNPAAVQEWTGPFNLISHAFISVRIPGGPGRSHNLWYCDAQIEGEYRWFETAFMDHPMATVVHIGEFSEPSATSPVEDRDEVESALGQIRGLRQVAWPFGIIDPADMQDFIDRWANWLAQCAANEFRRPEQLPEHDPRGSWRTS